MSDVMSYTNVMSYTTVARVFTALPAIGSASNITSATVAQYGADVQAKMNAKLSKLYTIPLTVEAPVLTALATDLTIYELLTKRVSAQFTDQQNQQNPFIRLRKDAWDMVDEIADGGAQIISSSGEVISASTGILITSTTRSYFPIFHGGNWNDMVQDPNALDALLQDRGFM